MKNFWLNEVHPGLFSLSFESDGAEPGCMLTVRELTFPSNRSKKAQRHTINIGLLTTADLALLVVKLRDAMPTEAVCDRPEQSSK